ncbi:trypsin-like peptidase domain-containing protein [Streptomyces massasporeus]|uniref:trypsin-like peptidase domain-containing protein n=1 Tax=Streptomyces massasporeus TaxID=67324 RepID=UPI00381736DC
MSYSTQAMKATAAVLVDGVRQGCAVLINHRYLLTASHVVTRHDGFRRVAVDEADVVFPAVIGLNGEPAQTLARRVPPHPGTDSLDAAVLDLGEEVLAWLPIPLALSPRRRVPTRVSVFGFPLGESEPSGIWVQFDTAGPTAVGSVQMDWVRSVGTLRGHSGGPVLDPRTNIMVGVLVEGSERGKFDRFIPAGSIADRWPDLPRPWLLSGPDSAEAVEHFHLRARGQRSQSRGGDLFRGRGTALAVVRKWLTAADAPGRPLVIVGQPGAGKSAVIARAVLDLQTDRVGPGVAFHARGATHPDLLRAVADLTGAEHANSTHDLVAALQELRGGPWPVVVDAVDEASTPTDRRKIARLLTELAALPALRVAVATRPLTPGTGESRYRLGALLPALGVSSSDSPSLVDLDADQYFDPTGMHEYATALLIQSGAGHPGPPDGAWARYRTDPSLCDRLASVVAARAGRNYLVAAMAAEQLSTRSQVVDPNDHGFDTVTVPASVREALDKYLDALDARRRVRVRGLLTALAYARGPGIDQRLWLAFATGLGYHVNIEDLDELHDSPAADYLLESSSADDGTPITRLFHQALTDEVLLPRHQPSDERTLLAVLTPRSQQGWAQASGYSRRHAADHAVVCDQLTNLLNDPHYLAVADYTRLLSLLPSHPADTEAPICEVLRQVGAYADPLPAERRVRLLALTAARNALPELSDRFSSSCRSKLVPLWAHSLGTPHQVLTGHRDWVRCVAVGRVGSRDIIASGSEDGTVRIWDAATGEPIGKLIHKAGVWGVAVGCAGDSGIIVSRSADKKTIVWDTATCQPIRYLKADAPLKSVATGQAGGRDVFATGGEGCTVWIWDAVTGEAIGAPLVADGRAVWSIALGRADERDIIAAATDTTMQIWDAVTRQPLWAHAIRSRVANWSYSRGSCVAMGRANDRDIIVFSSDIHAAHVRDAATGEHIRELHTDERESFPVVAAGRFGGRDIIASLSRIDRPWVLVPHEERQVRVWDAATVKPIGGPLVGHTYENVECLAIGRDGDREIIISGGKDATVRVWHSVTPESSQVPLVGHTDTVRSVVVGRVGDRDIVVSGSDDCTARIWDAATGQPLGDPITDHEMSVDAVAVGRVGGRDIVISGSQDGWALIWDAATGRPVTDPATGNHIGMGHGGSVWSVAVGRAGDRDIIASGGTEGEVLIWNAFRTQPPLVGIGHKDRVWSVAVGRVGDRDIVVSGSADCTVRIWDAATGQKVRRGRLRGHSEAVLSVAVGRVGDRDIIVSGSADCTVRIWDAATRQPIGKPFHSHSRGVTTIAIGRIGDRDVIVSGSVDGTARIWNPAGTLLDVLDLLVPVESVALSPDGALYVAAAMSVCAYAPPINRRSHVTARGDGT